MTEAAAGEVILYAEDDLDESATCRKSRQVRTKSSRRVVREVAFCNLDAIISVGYEPTCMKDAPPLSARGSGDHAPPIDEIVADLEGVQS